MKTQETPVSALQRILTAHQDRITQLSSTIRPERLIRIAVTAMHTTPALQDCSMPSILNALMLAAQIGLEPNTPLGHAYLVPYKRQCVLQIGYRGMIELAYRSGMLEAIEAHTVHEHDRFRVCYGTSPELVHEPHLTDPGDWIGVYALARLTGGHTCFRYMSRREVEAIRDRWAHADTGDKRATSPWQTAAEEMAKKTVAKRLLKWLRLAPELSLAIAADDQADHSQSQELVLDDDIAEIAERADIDLAPDPSVREQVLTRKLAEARAAQQQHKPAGLQLAKQSATSE